jgi:16S rRNA (adenine1518-N6/adenine1519-N6)-dimethyltransferase
MGQKLGQHFLRDKEVLRQILEAAQLTSDDRVLEVGPGRGVLTTPLCRKVARVVAFEIDTALARQLAARPNLEIVPGDFLQCFPNASVDGTGWKVVANLPYLVTTPILEKLIENVNTFASMVLMMQWEVAERITSPGTRESGALTFFVQFWMEAELLFKVAPAAFDPPPKVDSAVIRLTPRKELPCPRPERLFRLVRTAFADRRKMLHKSLSGMLSLFVFEQAGVDPQRRPETLTLSEFIALEASWHVSLQVNSAKNDG